MNIYEGNGYLNIILPTLTVMTPSLPTFFMASDNNSPIDLSPLAEIVATYKDYNSHAINSFLLFLLKHTL